MKIRCAPRRLAGNTVVEVVIATFVLAIMASGIMGSFTYGFHTMQLVRQNQRATQILLEKLETIRLYNWEQVNTPGFIPDHFPEVFDPQGAPDARGISYTGTVVISDVPFTTSYSTNLKQVSLTLEWKTGEISHTRSLSTLIARDGVQNYVY